MKVLIINGPNLNRLGKRQPEVYGRATLEDVDKRVRKQAEELGVDVELRQSNHEGDLIDWVHEAADQAWPVIINPGGFTHTSVALRDAVAEVAEGQGFIEVHISNVYAREPFRAHSYLSPLARGVIAGLGIDGYALALEFLATANKR